MCMYTCSILSIRVMSSIAIKGLEAFDEPLFLSPTLVILTPLTLTLPLYFA